MDRCSVCNEAFLPWQGQTGSYCLDCALLNFAAVVPAPPPVVPSRTREDDC